MLLFDGVILLSDTWYKLVIVVELHLQMVIFERRYLLGGVLVDVFDEELGLGLRQAVLEQLLVVVEVLGVGDGIGREPVLRVQLLVVVLLDFELLVVLVCDLLRVLLRNHVDGRLLLGRLLLGLHLVRQAGRMVVDALLRRALGLVMDATSRRLAAPQVVEVKPRHWMDAFLQSEGVASGCLAALLLTRVLKMARQARLASELAIEAFEAIECFRVHVESVEEVGVNGLLATDAQVLLLDRRLLTLLTHG